MSPEREADDIAVLKPIVSVKRGEVGALFVSMLWIFLALTAYYIIKPIRSTVLQTLIGVDNKSIALVLTTAFVGVFAYCYGKIVPRVRRRSLVVGTFLVFVGCLGAFALALPSGKQMAGGSPIVGYVFYVWVSTFNVMIVSQFWSVASEAWTKEQGVRLFGAIGVGGVAGSIFGTAVVSRYASKLPIYQLLLLSALLLLVCLALSLYVLAYAARKSAIAAPPSSKKIEEAPNAIMLVLGSPYLRLVAVMMLVLNIVNTNNEWVLDKVIARSELDTGALNAFYGEYFLFQNVITFLIQFLLTARVQRRFGAGGALFFEPTVGILGGLAFLAAPVLGVIKWHKILENACDYSIQSNTRELLYVPVSPVEKYSAKNLNDTFVVRIGDALAAGSIYIAATVIIPILGDVGLKALIVFDILLGVGWLFIAAAIGRMYKLRMDAAATPVI